MHAYTQSMTSVNMQISLVLKISTVLKRDIHKAYSLHTYLMFTWLDKSANICL